MKSSGWCFFERKRKVISRYGLAVPCCPPLPQFRGGDGWRAPPPSPSPCFSPCCWRCSPSSVAAPWPSPQSDPRDSFGGWPEGLAPGGRPGPDRHRLRGRHTGRNGPDHRPVARAVLCPARTLERRLAAVELWDWDMARAPHTPPQ